MNSDYRINSNDNGNVCLEILVLFVRVESNSVTITDLLGVLSP